MRATLMVDIQLIRFFSTYICWFLARVMIAHTLLSGSGAWKSI